MINEFPILTEQKCQHSLKFSTVKPKTTTIDTYHAYIVKITEQILLPHSQVDLAEETLKQSEKADVVSLY